MDKYAKNANKKQRSTVEMFQKDWVVWFISKEMKKIKKNSQVKKVK